MKLIVGKNDLATTHPELAKEADGWDPKTVTTGSSKKMQWKCLSGHNWITRVSHRTKSKSDCPICSNQKLLVGYNDLATTNPELAKEAHGWDPRKVIGGTRKKLRWICKKDHTWTATGDKRSQGRGCPICSSQKLLVGYNDLATTNPELAKEADGWDPKKVFEGTNKRLKWRCKQGHTWISTSNNRKFGRGCPICSNKKLLVGYNDLATTNPELAKQADGWDATTVFAGTHKELSWRCKQGHVWTATGLDRSTGRGCPICSSQKLLVGYNDLATTNPELAKQADGWDATTVFAGTNDKFQWKCPEGHLWIASVNNRNTGRGCPSCSITGFNPNIDGYLYFLIQPKWEIYQIGITNFPNDRLKRHKKNGFELLELRGPMDGHTAQELETAILRYLKSKKADLSPEQIAGKFDGYSESWTIDSYKVNNLKELIDKASEAGF
jgi:Zn finger protein HypA/HybF involved in hydrogenase expression